jgi:hypothetical protein
VIESCVLLNVDFNINVAVSTSSFQLSEKGFRLSRIIKYGVFRFTPRDMFCHYLPNVLYQTREHIRLTEAGGWMNSRNDAEMFQAGVGGSSPWADTKSGDTLNSKDATRRTVSKSNHCSGGVTKFVV